MTTVTQEFSTLMTLWYTYRLFWYRTRVDHVGWYLAADASIDTAANSQIGFVDCVCLRAGNVREANSHVMALHWVKIISSGHLSTQRLFELGLSFGVCKQKRRWPSLGTMNSFLIRGADDGALGTDIQWEPCTLTQQEYEQAVTAFMQSEPFTMDTEDRAWEEWFTQISDDNGG
jgi:hypothetical protein